MLPGGALSLDVKLPNGDTIKRPYVLEDEFFPGSTSDSGTITAEVVYVGYGITAPELGYDDYAGVDVKGKLVMIEPEIAGRPRTATPSCSRSGVPTRSTTTRSRTPSKHGAAGMVYNYLIANPNCVFVKGFGLTAVGRTVVDDVFAGTGRKHDDVVRSIQTTLKPASFATGKVMTMKNVTEHHPEGIGSNVVGWIEGTDPVLKQEAIVIGAHLDHLGFNPLLMPGAHDNASGVAVLLGVARGAGRVEDPVQALDRLRAVRRRGAGRQGVGVLRRPPVHPEREDGGDAEPGERRARRVDQRGLGHGTSRRCGRSIDRENKQYIHRPVTPNSNANLARPRQDAAHFLWAGVPTISFGTGGAQAAAVRDLPHLEGLDRHHHAGHHGGPLAAAVPDDGGTRDEVGPPSRPQATGNGLRAVSRGLR